MDVVFDLLPVFGGEVFLQFGEATFGGADKVSNRWIGLAHLSEGFFGGDAAIHDPGALLFAVAVGDFFQHAGERGFVGGVAAHDFVADGKSVRGDDEGDDDLHAVGALVAAVAEGFDFARFGDRAVGIDLEVGAGEVVEQDVVSGAEESRPAILEVGEEFFPMLQKSIVTAVEGVFGGDAEVVIEEVGHGAAVEPGTVETPLAAGFQQSVGDEGFEDFEPGCAFLGVGQERLPEGVEVEAVPEFQGEPAAAPLAWAGEFDVGETQPEGGMFEQGIGRAVFRKKMNLADLLAFIDSFDGAGPTCAVAVVDLAEIEQGFLDGTTTGDAAVFDDTPVAVLFAVFESFVGAQEHKLAPRIDLLNPVCRWGGSPPQPFSDTRRCEIKGSSASEGSN